MQCSFCNKEAFSGSGGILFSDVTDFVTENVSSIEDGRYFCKPCNKNIAHYRSLVRHVKDRHLEHKIKYHCPYCVKMAPNKAAFRQHVKRLHTPEEYKSLDMDQCAFYDTHPYSNVNKYKCPHCNVDKILPSPMALRHHIRNYHGIAQSKGLNFDDFKIHADEDVSDE